MIGGALEEGGQNAFRFAVRPAATSSCDTVPGDRSSGFALNAPEVFGASSPSRALRRDRAGSVRGSLCVVKSGVESAIPVVLTPAIEAVRRRSVIARSNRSTESFAFIDIVDRRGARERPASAAVGRTNRTVPRKILRAGRRTERSATSGIESLIRCIVTRCSPIMPGTCLPNRGWLQLVAGASIGSRSRIRLIAATFAESRTAITIIKHRPQVLYSLSELVLATSQLRGTLRRFPRPARILGPRRCRD